MLGTLALLVVVVPVGVGAFSFRRRVLPTWSRAPARLAEVVIGVATVVMVSELLGTVGLFKRVAVAVSCAVAGGILTLAGRSIALSAPPATETLEPECLPLARPVVVVAVALVASQWTTHVVNVLRNGVSHTDSLWYHLPRAARFVQEGSLTKQLFTRPEFPDNFHPAITELLHGLGMLLYQRDVLTPLLGAVWLAFALLAGWCVGAPSRLGPMTMLGTAVLVGTPHLAIDSAGTASNDILALAFLLAAVALLVQPGRPRPAILLAGLAAGLGLGTKLTLIAPVGALTLGLIVIAGRGHRWRVAHDWMVALVVGGGYFYVRNWVRTGTPLAGVSLPLFPNPKFEIVDRFGRSVAHYVTDGDVWRTWFLPGLQFAYGRAWPVLLGLAGAGAVLAIVRSRDQMLRVLGVTSVVGLVAYVVTPTTALGTAEGSPILFTSNLRYASPVLGLGLVLLPLTVGRSQRALAAVLIADVGVLGVAFVARTPPAWDTAHLLPGVVATIAVCGLWALAALGVRVSWARSRSGVLAMAGIAMVVGAIASYPVFRSHLRTRYAGDPVALWAKNLDGERIAVAGADKQYRLYGDRLTNVVQYVGVEGPHGEFHDFEDCAAWRAALRAGQYGWVYIETGAALSPPHVEWLRGDAAAHEILHTGRQYVFRFDPSIDDTGCRPSA
jgi:hypothetical protein